MSKFVNIPGVKLSEKVFAERVLALAADNGWRAAHFRPARVMRDGRETYETPVDADGKGFPDLVLVRGRRLIFAELKSDAGKTTPAQDKWLDALAGAGATCCIWRPADWAFIEAELGGAE
jgi:hypothetical protein